jgi:hypothetical protein
MKTASLLSGSFSIFLIEAPALSTSPNVILLANPHNPHFCVGSNRDKSEIPNDSKPFANSIKCGQEPFSLPPAGNNADLVLLVMP